MTATTKPAIVRLVRVGETAGAGGTIAGDGPASSARTVTISSHRGQIVRPLIGGGFGAGTGALQYGQLIGISHPAALERL
jgi:hypothetical protein